jgi:general secretion pathway protein D
MVHGDDESSKDNDAFRDSEEERRAEGDASQVAAICGDADGARSGRGHGRLCRLAGVQSREYRGEGRRVGRRRRSYRRALEADPKNPEYRIALQRAMGSAAQDYAERGRIAEVRGQLEDALRNYRRASEYDPQSGPLAAKVSELDRKLRALAEQAQPKSTIQQLREAARQATPALFRLNEVLPALNFTNAAPRDILTTIGKMAGINVQFDQAYNDQGRPYSMEMEGVTLEQALNAVTQANQLFYKVTNQRTILVANDTQQKHAQYDDQVIKVLRLSHADATEVTAMLQQMIRITGGTAVVQFAVTANKTQNSITVRAPLNVAQIIEKVVDIVDTPRAEVVIEVEILEVRKSRLKQYGLDLGNYTIGAVYSPESDPRNGSALNPPAFNLNTPFRGINRGDFYLAVPSAAIRFLESDSQTKLLAKTQLRGSEGQKLTLNLGEDVPVPSTVFTPIAQGGANVSPLSSFNYRTVGIVLEATPRVTYEDEVMIDMNVENSTRAPDVNVGGTNLPSFSTRKVTGQLRLRDGEPNLLAGLLQENDRRSLTGFPGILHLPVIKQLFSSNDETIEQTDIIMLMTPRIIRSHELTQEDLQALFIGTTGNLGLGGGPPPLMAPSAVDPALTAPGNAPAGAPRGTARAAEPGHTSGARWPACANAGEPGRAATAARRTAIRSAAAGDNAGTHGAPTAVASDGNRVNGQYTAGWGDGRARSGRRRHSDRHGGWPD